MTPIVVTAAVIQREDRFLLTRRPRGVHLEGYWEFPGGKCEVGEEHGACLARELREELAVEARVGAELLVTTHAYADREIEIHFIRCDILGDPRPQLGQDMQWVGRADLARLPLPPADVDVVRLLTDEG